MDALQSASVQLAFEPGERIFDDLDAVSCEAVAIVLGLLRWAIRQQDDIGTPHRQLEREARTIAFAAVYGEKLVPMLPAIAIRAGIDPMPVELDRAREFRRVVHPAGREEELSRPLPLAILEGDLESVADLLGPDHFTLAEGDTRVFCDLLDRISPDQPRPGAI